jgi:hypothetical protein
MASKLAKTILLISVTVFSGCRTQEEQMPAEYTEAQAAAVNRSVQSLKEQIKNKSTNEYYTR